MKLSTLRDRSNAKLPALKTQTKKVEWGEARVQVEDVGAITSRQVWRYDAENGTEPWMDKFVRLRDLEPKVAKEAWRAVPNSKFKRFQQVFSDPWNYSVPSITTDSKGNFSGFKENPDFLRRSVKSCLVSADRIPDNLVQRLGLADLGELKGNPLARLKVKDVNVAQSLKLHWDASQQLDSGTPGGSYRVMKIMSPSESLRAIYPNVAPPKQHTIGAYLVTKGNVDTKLYLNMEPEIEKKYAPLARGMSVSYFDNTDSAKRKTFHQGQRQSTESIHLEEIEETVRSLAHQISIGWKPNTPQADKNEMAKNVNTALAMLEKTLEHCLDEYKVEAKQFLSKISDGFFDKTGRPNPSAVILKLNAATTRLKKRVDIIKPIAKSNLIDRENLEQEKSRDLASFRSFMVKISRIASEFPSQNIESSFQALEVINQNEGIDFSKIFSRPLYPFVAKVLEKQQELQVALEKNELEEAKGLFLQIHLIGKIAETTLIFARINKAIANNSDLPISQIKKFVHDFKIPLIKRQLYPEVELPTAENDSSAKQEQELLPFGIAFGEINKRIDLIGNGLRYYENAGYDEGSMNPDRRKMYQRLKNYLKDFDFDEMVDTL